MIRLLVSVAALLMFCGCSGEVNVAGISGGDTDSAPCAWLPVPNQEATIDAMLVLRAAEVSRTEVFTTVFPILASEPNFFDPTPIEVSICLDDLLDEAYGGIIRRPVQPVVADDSIGGGT